MTIPEGVTSIGSKAFSPDIKDIYCYATSVPSANMSFEAVDLEFATLHVPASAIDSYRSTEPWSKFGNIVGIEETGIIGQTADEVKISAREGYIMVEGVAENEPITVYDTAGKIIGSTLAGSTSNTIINPFRKGDVGIVKIGDKTYKTLIK